MQRQVKSSNFAEPFNCRIFEYFHESIASGNSLLRRRCLKQKIKIMGELNASQQFWMFRFQNRYVNVKCEFDLRVLRNPERLGNRSYRVSHGIQSVTTTLPCSYKETLRVDRVGFSGYDVAGEK